nr:MAG TPA_asm: tail sheath protein [Caudoviricetes sp.]
MAVPAVSIIWDDQSAINKVNTVVEDTVDRPIIMVASSADKGPEEWKTKIMGQTFYDYYGQVPSFSKHGQPLIQAANAIDAGAYVTFKRVVADDATLANIGIVAELKYTSVGYTDPTTGMFVWEYKDPSGVVKRQFSNTDPSTSSKTYTQVFTNQVNVAFKAVTYNLGGTSVGANSNKPSDFANQLFNTYAHKGTVGSNDQTYPLFMITDNGRGESKKRFRISRDTTTSRPVNYVRYFIEVMENDKTLETFAFTLNPDIIEQDRNVNIQNVIRSRSHQIRCVFFEDEFNAFCENVASLLNVTTSVDTDTLITTGVTADEFKRQDPIFGTDFYGNTYTYLKCDYAILNNVFGIQLANGTNGSFGDAPIKAAGYSAQLVQAFDGTFDDSIYDLDNNRIDAIFDANYPNPVKRAIEDLVTFREDCMYFRDMGLGLASIGNIRVNDKFNLKNRFCATYVNSYDIYDPYTRKQISVTVMYDLVRLFVKHFINGRTRPFCGDKYGVDIPIDNMVPGTLNFSPKRTPSLDQKQELDDMRINYLSFYDGNILAMNSEYTSQSEYTQLSWINNVLAVQQVIKAIRVLCPKIRYSFLDGEDLQNYKKDVQNLIVDKYSSLFKSFSIEYVEDGTYDSNKIIYACLYAKFRNFVQTEIFKIIALQS